MTWADEAREQIMQGAVKLTMGVNRAEKTLAEAIRERDEMAAAVVEKTARIAQLTESVRHADNRVHYLTTALRDVHDVLLPEKPMVGEIDGPVEAAFALVAQALNTPVSALLERPDGEVGS